jgi:dienelactone hydrolase
MGEGGEGMLRHAVWFSKNAKLNTLIVTRRGYRPSGGSSINSGELAVFYDVQASISFLIKEKGINIESIAIYGYSLGGLYAAVGAAHFRNMAGFILDRPFPDYLSNTARVSNAI